MAIMMCSYDCVPPCSDSNVWLSYLIYDVMHAIAHINTLAGLSASLLTHCCGHFLYHADSVRSSLLCIRRTGECLAPQFRVLTVWKNYACCSEGIYDLKPRVPSTCIRNQLLRYGMFVC